jgi:hypothetical protein
MTDTQESFPQATTGLNTTVGVQITGSGVTVGTGAYEYSVQLEYGSTAMVTATPVDSSGTAQSATVTAVSYNGAPTETGEASEFTTYPIGGGGAQYANIPNQYNGRADVIGIGAQSNVASVTPSAPFIVTANNTGSALIEFRAQGRTGRLNVVVENVVQA